MSIATRVARKEKKAVNKIKIVAPAGLNALSEFMDTIIFSCCVKGKHDPLSAIIDDYPESEKWKLFSRYLRTDGIQVISVACRNTIDEWDDAINAGALKYFIVPDVDKLIQGRSYLSWDVLNGIDAYSKRATLDENQCSFICASPPSQFTTLINRWDKWMGLVEEIFPFLVDDVSKDITSSLATSQRRGKPPTLDFERTDVKLTEDVRKDIKQLRKFIGELDSTFKFCVPSKSLIRFAKSHALLRGDEQVTANDIKFIQSLVPFWCGSGGNDCQYYIIQNLPSTLSKLTSKIPYPRLRIAQELRALRKRHIITREERGGKIYFSFTC